METTTTTTRATALASASSPAPSDDKLTSIPDLRFGLIADIHYLDAENATNYDKTKIRRFRQSLSILQNAMNAFQNVTSFNVFLGDMLDGKAKTLGMNYSCLKTLHDLCQQQSNQPWYMVLGNHEYYNFTRSEIFNHVYFSYIQDKCSESQLYYSFKPKDGYRCIVLDGYEISTIGPLTPQDGQDAENLLLQRNHNYAAGSTDWLHGMADENLRYLPFNGGISLKQLEWLRLQLSEAIQNNEKCLVFSHMAIYRNASQEQNLLWNCEDVLKVLHETPRGTVMSVISGHDHDGGYSVDDHGIHHLVPCSPIECDEGEMSYGIIEIYLNEQKMKINWTGKVPPRIWGDTLSFAP